MQAVFPAQNFVVGPDAVTKEAFKAPGHALFRADDPSIRAPVLTGVAVPVCAAHPERPRS